jgi:hypothetical protein
MKTKIEYIKHKTKYGFIGMNKNTANKKNINWNHKKHPSHIIEVYHDVPKSVRVHTIRHEECEQYLMKNKHYSYKKAHALALKFEKLNKPFPSTNIKRRLIKMGAKTK